MDPTQVLTLISLGTDVVLRLEPIVLDQAVKLKHLLELNPDIKVNITNLAGEAITADEATMDLVNQWKKDNGLPELPKT